MTEWASQSAVTLVGAIRDKKNCRRTGLPEKGHIDQPPRSQEKRPFGLQGGRLDG